MLLSKAFRVHDYHTPKNCFRQTVFNDPICQETIRALCFLLMPKTFTDDWKSVALDGNADSAHTPTLNQYAFQRVFLQIQCKYLEDQL